ncbi:hypothetical protein B9S53_25790, partial [Arthrospira sp. O9.13F]
MGRNIVGIYFVPTARVPKIIFKSNDYQTFLEKLPQEPIIIHPSNPNHTTDIVDRTVGKGLNLLTVK